MKKEKPADAKALGLDALTQAGYSILQTLCRQPDPVLARLIRLSRQSAGRSAGADPEFLQRLEELENFFRNPSPFSKATRNIFLLARPAQLKSVIRGFLANYALPPDRFETGPFAGTGTTSKRTKSLKASKAVRKSATKKIRIGIAGQGPIGPLIAEAYAGAQKVGSVVWLRPEGKRPMRGNANLPADFLRDWDEFLNRTDAVEIVGGDGERSAGELTMALLAAGKHVSLQKPFAESLEEADRLIGAARRAGVFLRVNDPALFHEPYLRLQTLLDDGEIGELASLRIRSSLAGTGGAGPLFKDFKGGRILFHPAFDNFSLLARLFGEAESVKAFLNPMTAGRGGQALIGLKGKTPGRYASLELTFAPKTCIRSDFLPCDDGIEAAGTDGVIWANHFHGKSTETPSVEVRRGKTHYAWGASVGMKTEWKDSLRASAQHFVDAIADGVQPDLSAAEARNSLVVLLAVKEAAAWGREVRI